MITMQPSEKSRLRKRRDGQQRERMRDFPQSKQCKYINCFCSKIKSVYKPNDPSGRSLSQCLSISTPPGWDASPLQGYLQQ